MAFWNMVNIEPKRTFRYYVTFGKVLGDETGVGDISMFATSVDRPKFEVSFKEFQYLNHQFNFPGRLKWSDVKMKFVDAGGSAGGTVVDVARTMMRVLNNSGYVIPESGETQFRTLSKAAFNANIGDITIKLLAGGHVQNTTAVGNVLEEWTLKNAMFGNVDFSSLTYDNEDFSTVDLTVKYDYAYLTVFDATGKRVESNNQIPSSTPKESSTAPGTQTNTAGGGGG